MVISLRNMLLFSILAAALGCAGAAPPMPEFATMPVAGDRGDVESAWGEVQIQFNNWSPPPGGNKMPIEFRDALTKFLHFQDPAFRGRPEAFQLVRTREAENVYCVCFEESEDKEDARSITFGRSLHLQGSFEHFLLDASGEKLPTKWKCASHEDQQEHHIEPVRGGGYDLIRLKDALRSISPSLEYSVDVDGFVPEGEVDATEFLTPHRLNAEAVPFDHLAVEAFLASSKPGDLFRALWQIDVASGHGDPPAGGATLGAALFEHPDSDVRARAIAVLGENRLDSLAEFVTDPSPRVRIAALHQLYVHGRETDFALKLAQEADKAVALVACQYLCFNRDLEVARKSLLRLIAERDFRAVGDHHYDLATYRRFSELSSPEVVEALAAWMEAELENALRDRESGIGHVVLDIPNNLPRLRAEHLRPFASRLVALCERIAPADNLTLRSGLFVSLIKSEDPAADRFLARLFEQSGLFVADDVEGVWRSVFGDSARLYGHPLFARSKPLVPSVPILLAIAARSRTVPKEQSNPFGFAPCATKEKPDQGTDQRKKLEFDGDSTDALALLAKWNVPGAEAALIEDLSTEPTVGAQESFTRLIGAKLLPSELIERLKSAAREANWPEEQLRATFEKGDE